jgi:hypothetical protein
MARFVIAAILAVVPVLGLVPGVRAQIPPLEDVTDPIQETADQIEETVDPVEDVVDEVGGTVDQAAGDVVETVEQTAGGTSGTLGQAGGAAATGAGGVDGGGATGTLSGAGGAGDAEAGSSSSGGEQAKRRNSRTRTGRAPSDRADGEGGGFRMARVVSATGSASVVPLVYVPLVVRLTNDADGDGVYAEAESAPRPGVDIPFQLRLENAGPYELTILAIRDNSPQSRSENGQCGDLIGTTLATNQSAVCRFTVEGLAPTGGERLVAVVEVDAAETADPSTTGTVTDTTVIRTEDVGVLGEVVRGVVGSLATTGARIGLLAAVAVGLTGVGVWMIRSGNRRREVFPAWVRSTAGAPGTLARTEADMRSPRPGRGRGHAIGSSLAGHSAVRRKGLTGTARRGG